MIHDIIEAEAERARLEVAYDESVTVYMAAVRALDDVYLEQGPNSPEYETARLAEYSAKEHSDTVWEAFKEAMRRVASFRR